MARFLLHPLGSELDEVLGASERRRNRQHQVQLEDRLLQAREQARQGWGERYQQRVHAKGKLTTRERVAALIDPGSPLLEVGTLANHGLDFRGKTSPAAGVVTALARVEQRWCVVVANDNTVASGAWWPGTPEKIQRAQEVALRLGLPVVYLVDCSGLFLPEQSRSFPGRRASGHIFHRNASLAAAGVPQVAGVFGDSIAGGGYMPIISDRVIMTEAAYMVIAGAALVRGAKSRRLTSLDIGGPEVHVHQSRCADERAPDDVTALRLIREAVSQLPSSAADFYRHGASALEPGFSPRELRSLFPVDHRRPYDIEQVLARLVDGSLFHEVLPGVGREVLTGVARISGLWMGFCANRLGMVEEPEVGHRPGGVLYREGIAKLSVFARACHEDGIPLVWLQDVSGFDIGAQAEQQGLLGYGSSLIYSNSTARSPFFTVLLRKASGAGYFAMAGLPYDPVLQLATPLTRLAVMEGRTLATAAYATRLDGDFQPLSDDPQEIAELQQDMDRVAQRIERDMDPLAAAARMDVDEVVRTEELRTWLVALAEASWQASGFRRIRNPRIWSLHDLEVLHREKL